MENVDPTTVILISIVLIIALAIVLWHKSEESQKIQKLKDLATKGKIGIVKRIERNFVTNYFFPSYVYESALSCLTNSYYSALSKIVLDDDTELYSETPAADIKDGDKIRYLTTNNREIEVYEVV